MPDGPDPAGRPPVPPLDAQSLVVPVQRAIGERHAVPTAWAVRSIYHPTLASTDGVYRVTGTAAVTGQTIAWSLILKRLVAPAPAGAAGAAGLAWQREALAYESGLLADLPDGLRAPRCFGVERPDAAHAGIWLEDLAGAQEPPFTAAQYRLLARGLGAFAGAYLTTRSLPASPWLVQRNARRFVEQAAQQMATLDRLRDHPLVHRAWPADVLGRILRVHDEAAALLQALEARPHSVCHQDAVPRNLFVRQEAGGPPEAVAIDWGLVGVGPLGRDLAYLVPGGVHTLQLAPEALPDIEAVALDGYLTGLADVGWDGAARDVRLGYLLSLGLRFGIYPVPLLAADAGWRAQTERSFGVSIEALLDAGREEQRFCLDRLDQARALLRSGDERPLRQEPRGHGPPPA